MEVIGCAMYIASLERPLRYKQWLLEHEMGFLHEMDLSGSAQEESFLNALLMNYCLKNELCNALWYES